jgi:hypothetical protein
MRLVVEAPDDDQAVLNVPHPKSRTSRPQHRAVGRDVHVGQKTVTP